MTQKKSKIPLLKLHKHSGQAYVNLNGNRHYLGKFDAPGVDRKYQRLIAEWEAGNRQPLILQDEITVVELCARFWTFIQDYYAPPSKECTHFKIVIGILNELYGDTDASSFGPKALKTVRESMIDRKWVRSNINKQIVRLKKVFQWGTAEELISPNVYYGLKSVSGLKRGRSNAKDNPPVKPVPQEHIDAVLEHVPPEIAALIQLQLYTAARPSELIHMRPIDIDTRGKIWLHTPQQHKTSHHGHCRTVYLGPKSQSIIAPFLAGCPVEGFLFSPKRAQEYRNAQCKTHRRPKQQANSKMTDRTVGDCYTVGSYRRCISRICEEHDIPAWTPHRLRHSSATNIRQEFGLEGAQLLCGHKRCDVTQVYAEQDHAKALTIAKKLG